MSEPKEPNFFDREFEKGLDWYKKCFSGYNYEKVIGEATTGYFASGHLTVKRIFETIPNVKLIFILRNPIDRLISEYWFYVKAGFITHKPYQLEALISGENKMLDVWDKDYTFFERLLDRGFYDKHLNTFYDVFPSDQIKVVFFEDFVKDTEKTLTEIFNYIGIVKSNDQEFNKYNEAEYPSKLYFIYSRVWAPIKPYFPNALLNYLFYVKKHFRKLFFEKDKPELKYQLRKKLVNIYIPTIDKIGEMFNRELESWKY